MTLLILRLEGALQSWGDHSRWDHRDSSEMPTKSGIVGMIGCAMGIARGDSKLAELAKSIRLAVRADRQGTMMTDFHTVQGRQGKLMNAEGKPRSSTIVTPRDYLEDGCYSVFLEGKKEILDEINAALHSPVWIPYLGRKSCPPSVPLLPILTDNYETLEEAVTKFRWEKPEVRNLSVNMRAEIEDPHGERERNDQTICSAQYQYARRYVRDLYVRREQKCT